MTDLIELRRNLTNARNDPSKSPAEKSHLGILILNVEGLLDDPGNEDVRKQFGKNVARYEARRAGRA
jgi:hypothetical protein